MLNFNFIIIAFAIVGNKNDLENKAVDENEVQQLAKDLDAIFQTTSAKSPDGIEDLFNKITTKILDSNLIPKEDSENLNLINQKKKKKKKSSCCF